MIRRVADEVAARLGAHASRHAPQGSGAVLEEAEDTGRCEIFPDPGPERTLERGYIPIGVSARHCHVTAEQVEILFGKGAALEPLKPLKQTGQFAAKQTVSIIGPRGRALERVRILGPARSETQVEVSLTDCIQLGIEPPVRPSGDHRGTPGLLMVGPAGHLAMERGVIRANRHVHLSTEEAALLGLRDRQTVLLKVDGDRPVLFYDVQVRVAPNFRAELHLDTDDANAVGLGAGAVAQLVRSLGDIPDCGCLVRGG
ncbi:MAG: phosphate propanoyltransferase [Candidatus Sumerlaeia bacterium]|nr:phosphate propanoyltransferase [Candidatus Sumerlaeia bacterium]